MRIEWRTNNAYDSVLRIDDDGKLLDWADASSISAGKSRPILADLLVEPIELESWSMDEPTSTDPEDYGELVLARETGDDGAEIPSVRLLAKRLAFHFRATD